jgi:hypothetical protein
MGRGDLRPRPAFPPPPISPESLRRGLRERARRRRAERGTQRSRPTDVDRGLAPPPLRFYREPGTQFASPEMLPPQEPQPPPGRIVPPPLPPEFQRGPRPERRRRERPRRGAQSAPPPPAQQSPDESETAGVEARIQQAERDVESLRRQARGTARPDADPERPPPPWATMAPSPLKWPMREEYRERARQRMRGIIDGRLERSDPRITSPRAAERRPWLPSHVPGRRLALPRLPLLLQPGDEFGHRMGREWDDLLARNPDSPPLGVLEGLRRVVVRIIEAIGVLLQSPDLLRQLGESLSQVELEDLRTLLIMDREALEIVGEVVRSEMDDPQALRELGNALMVPFDDIARHFVEGVQLAEPSEYRGTDSAAHIVEGAFGFIRILDLLDSFMSLRHVPTFARRLHRVRAAIERLRRRHEHSLLARVLRDTRGSGSPLAPFVQRGTAREAGRTAYRQLEESGWQTSGPQRSIYPDRQRYPTLEIRPNGDILGTHGDVTRYVRDARLSGRRRLTFTTVESHHLIEDRLMEMFGVARNDGRCVALEATDHAVFSGELPRYARRGLFRDIDEIFDAHAAMYREAGHPEWIPEMRRFLREHRAKIRHAYERGRVPGGRAADFPERWARVRRFLDDL